MSRRNTAKAAPQPQIYPAASLPGLATDMQYEIMRYLPATALVALSKTSISLGMLFTACGYCGEDE